MGALLKPGPHTTLASPADTHWVTWHGEDLNWNLSLLFWCLKSCLKCSPSFSQTWRFDPPSQRGSTRVTWDTTSSSTDLWCDVRLNIRIDILQTYSVLKISLVAWRTWMVSFLSSWVTTRDTGTIRYIQAVCFSQTTRQLDAWLLDMLGGGPEPKTCGSVHCDSLLVKQVEHYGSM